MSITGIDILYINDDFLSDWHILATYIMAHMKKIEKCNNSETFQKCVLYIYTQIDIKKYDKKYFCFGNFRF